MTSQKIADMSSRQPPGTPLDSAQRLKRLIKRDASLSQSDQLMIGATYFSSQICYLKVTLVQSLPQIFYYARSPDELLSRARWRCRFIVCLYYYLRSFMSFGTTTVH